MKKLLISFDDDTANLLSKQKNMSAFVRDAVKVYTSDISTDTLASIKTSYAAIGTAIKELDSKLDFIARKVQ